MSSQTPPQPPPAPQPAPTPLPQSRAGTHPHAIAAVAEVVEAVEAAEELVGHVVTAAERSLARRIGMRGLRVVELGLRVVWIGAILSYFAFGLTVLATRHLLLPHIDDWRPDIESIATAAMRMPVTVGGLEADWQGLNPRLLLRDVALMDVDGRTALALPQVDVVVSWTSLLAWQPRMVSLTVQAPEIEIKRLPDHRFTIAGIVIDPAATRSESSILDWVLAQQRIRVRDARVHLVDELGSAPGEPGTGAGDPAPAAAGGDAAAPVAAAGESMQWDLTGVNFLLTRGLTGHRFALQF